MTPTLVVMAAGMGSRYGGLKQIDPVGPGGERIIDYSLYDARRAGFGRVVFVIRRDMERVFRDAMEPGFPDGLRVDYAFQEIDAVPAGCPFPSARAKPWGTAHAVWCCRDLVDGPFGVVNADDFYGRAGFADLCAALAGCPPDGTRHALVAYRLANTLSAHGAVSRGVCEVGADGRLAGIVERARIRRMDGAILCDEPGAKVVLGADALVSMNMWGFVPSLFAVLEDAFRAFLFRSAGDPRSEFFIPSVVDDMVRERAADVIVVPTEAVWMGMTYPDDRASVRAGVSALVAAGEYPTPLR